MPARTRNILGTSWNWARTSSIVEFLKPLNSAELTKLSWATCIKSYTEVPDVYKDFFKSILADERVFPYTVMTPSYERFVHKTTEKLISDFGNDIYVLERKGDTFETQCYPIDGIIYVEMRTALLAASFKLCGLTNQGNYASSTLKFNSVTDYLFAPILKRVRPVPLDSKIVGQGTETNKFNCLGDVNFKFMNLAKHSLLEGEKVIQFILQPEIIEKILTILKKTYCRIISTTHMIILTDRELIVIQEEAIHMREDRYGGIWEYIPLNKIKSLSVSGENDGLLELTIQLPDETSYKLLFQASAEEELNQLSDRFKEITV